jgi:hypothetical protein
MRWMMVLYLAFSPGFAADAGRCGCNKTKTRKKKEEDGRKI